MSRQASATAAQQLDVPELSLVVLVGASGSGKSTFAAKHFLRTEVLSSDYCRGLVADDENDQAATNDAFELLHFIASKRLAGGRLTVVDATNVKREDRARLIKLARQHHFLPVAIVFDVPEALCRERNESRTDRDFGPHVIRNQTRDLRRGLRGLRKEGFRHVHTLSTPEAIDGASIRRTRLWNNRTDEHGPFDVIGDTPVVLLTCRGARSGVERTVPLLYFTDEGRAVLMASNYGGSRHPAWYHNVRANPEVTLTAGGVTGRFTAHETAGEERDRLWRLAQQLTRGYTQYERTTEGRTIPVMVFTQ